ncbi:hypothetical protein LVJ85_01325 [Neisseria sp. Dent CA1/247]|uniref:hypothetical protein n=1 Tax=Neisseria sp. Dent CA1/247 TaxID=2912675 RepID=UPI001FD15C03|nr:hypothetical protein [Neisseria sp. Dent CA1/247]UOO77178.1 hypothetical protein LVJ85_01325 [Neisseria sp. Dent CA1/247]
MPAKILPTSSGKVLRSVRPSENNKPEAAFFQTAPNPCQLWKPTLTPIRDSNNPAV